jgi:hypothetical protein
MKYEMSVQFRPQISSTANDEDDIELEFHLLSILNTDSPPSLQLSPEDDYKKMLENCVDNLFKGKNLNRVPDKRKKED